MRLLEIINAPWAIVPAQLEEIRDIYVTHLRGEKIDLKGIEAQLGRPLNNEPLPFEVRDGVAVVPIHGVLAKRMNLFQSISGGASYELIERDLRAAAASSQVESIVLDVDSPGGAVDGVQEVANVVRALREDGVRVVTFANGLMASAAYWIGAAAESVWISSDVAQVGSIGVVATHVDVSIAEAQRGIKTEEIVAGRFKRVASRHSPLTAEGRETIQAAVDQIYSVFVEDVARSRGTSVDDVIERMADGRVFIGQRAIEAGLVDGVSTLDDLVARLSQGEVLPGGAGAAPPPPSIDEGGPMDLETLRKEHPELVASLTADGAERERQRIADVRKVLIPGHEALIEKLAADGNTTGAEAAVQVVAAEQVRRAAIAADIHDDAPKPISDGGGAEPSGEGASSRGFDALVAELIEDGKSRREAIRLVSAMHPKAHRAYLDRVNPNKSELVAGLARIG